MERAVLLTVAYADIFDYPLTALEIHRYLTGMEIPIDELEKYLARQHVLHQTDGYYGLPGREDLADIRIRRERLSLRLWRHAVFFGSVIACLPFIRMVAITGSLAVNNVEKRADIDTMIITAEGRLWTSRALILGVARMASIYSVHLCPNYLITEKAMTLSDHSLYAARELTQMVPLYGMKCYNRLRALNSWTEQLLPNAFGPPLIKPPIKTKDRIPKIQPMLQALFLTSPGNWFEHWEMERKIRRLSQEQAGSVESTFSANQCKGHHLGHGSRLEQRLQKRLKDLSVEGVL